jgi:hypothetical protein
VPQDAHHHPERDAHRDRVRPSEGEHHQREGQRVQRPGRFEEAEEAVVHHVGRQAAERNRLVTDEAAVEVPPEVPRQAVLVAEGPWRLGLVLPVVAHGMEPRP